MTFTGKKEEAAGLRSLKRFPELNQNVTEETKREPALMGAKEFVECEKKKTHSWLGKHAPD